LFNRLTGAGVLADARMFATLDTTVRHLVLPSRRRALLSDTVGFIRNLPAELVKAFRATLEEVTEAALLLHVVDPGSPWAAEHVRQVYKVLSEINASAAPQILVLSKMDRFEPGAEAATLARRILLDAGAAPAEFPPAVAVSAHTGTGLQDLIALIDQQLPVDRLVRMRLRIPSTAGPARHMVHEYCHVLAEEWVEDGCVMEADVAESLVSRFRDFVVTEMG
jgi:GTP-binding protein HflX